MNDRRTLLAYLALLLLLIVVYFSYFQGVTGALYYDDFRPLSGLASVSDTASALVYIFGEISGPLGRPVSMISFLFNKNDWPNSVESIIHFNVILHCANAFLVFLLSWVLLQVCKPELGSARRAWIAVSVAALWALSPLLVSTSLIAVQRMTGLSAFFVLSGLTAYIACFKAFSGKPKRCLLVQAGAVFLFTLFAMFSKESGVLLPVFALVVEITLARSVGATQAGRSIRVTAFLLCFLLVLACLVKIALDADAGYAMRSYTMTERVITQPVILLDYIRLAFVPDLFSYSPFHDDYEVGASFGTVRVVLSAAAVALLILFALVWRKRFPVFSFAVLWFFAAHMIESTVVGLELYFEHRNYIALVGPALAIAFSIFNVAARYKVVARSLLLVYLCFLSFCTFQVASIWGQPALAAKIWFEDSKGSARAAEHYAIHLLESGQPDSAYQVLLQQAEVCPDCIGSQAQAMQLSCRFNDERLVEKYYARILNAGELAKTVDSAPSSLAATFKEVVDGHCKLLNLEQLKALNMSLLQSKTGGAKLALLVNLHRIAREEGDDTANIDNLRQAWDVDANLDVGRILVFSLVEAQRFSEARHFVASEMCKELPILPPMRREALAKCQAAESYLSEMVPEDASDGSLKE